MELKNKDLLYIESKGCFDFFWNEVNIDKSKKGYGLIRDRVPLNTDTASIASVGFGLTALTIGVEMGWVDYEAAKERAKGTLNTLMNNIENIKGFFYHFVHMETGKRIYNSEISIIDTAIAVNGCIVVGEYFGGQIKEISEKLCDRVEWDWFVDKEKKQFHMSYTEEKGFTGWWDFYAEQLMLYILAAASNNYKEKENIFYSFKRNRTRYKSGEYFINSWFGSIFTYQFSHAWIDFKNIKDKEGVDWWENSRIATEANRQFCIDNSKKFKSFGQDSWGLTACDGPWGYCGAYGSAPSAYINDEHFTDGTVPPCGAAGSIIFTPEYSLKALNNYYIKHPQLWGKYGFKDAFNLDMKIPWYADSYIGINKGITLLMIENYLTGFVWKIFMKNEKIKKSLEKLEFEHFKNSLPSI